MASSFILVNDLNHRTVTTHSLSLNILNYEKALTMVQDRMHEFPTYCDIY